MATVGMNAFLERGADSVNGTGDTTAYAVKCRRCCHPLIDIAKTTTSADGKRIAEGNALSETVVRVDDYFRCGTPDCEARIAFRSNSVESRMMVELNPNEIVVPSNGLVHSDSGESSEPEDPFEGDPVKVVSHPTQTNKVSLTNGPRLTEIDSSVALIVTEINPVSGCNVASRLDIPAWSAGDQIAPASLWNGHGYEPEGSNSIPGLDLTGSDASSTNLDKRTPSSRSDSPVPSRSRSRTPAQESTILKAPTPRRNSNSEVPNTHINPSPSRNSRSRTPVAVDQRPQSRSTSLSRPPNVSSQNRSPRHSISRSTSPVQKLPTHANGHSQSRSRSPIRRAEPFADESPPVDKGKRATGRRDASTSATVPSTQPAISQRDSVMNRSKRAPEPSSDADPPTPIDHNKPNNSSHVASGVVNSNLNRTDRRALRKEQESPLRSTYDVPSRNQLSNGGSPLGNGSDSGAVVRWDANVEKQNANTRSGDPSVSSFKTGVRFDGVTIEDIDNRFRDVEEAFIQTTHLLAHLKLRLDRTVRRDETERFEADPFGMRLRRPEEDPRVDDLLRRVEDLEAQERMNDGEVNSSFGESRVQALETMIARESNDRAAKLEAIKSELEAAVRAAQQREDDLRKELENITTIARRPSGEDGNTDGIGAPLATTIVTTLAGEASVVSEETRRAIEEGKRTMEELRLELQRTREQRAKGGAVEGQDKETERLKRIIREQGEEQVRLQKQLEERNREQDHFRKRFEQQEAHLRKLQEERVAEVKKLELRFDQVTGGLKERLENQEREGTSLRQLLEERDRIGNEIQKQFDLQKREGDEWRLKVEAFMEQSQGIMILPANANLPRPHISKMALTPGVLLEDINLPPNETRLGIAPPPNPPDVLSERVPVVPTRTYKSHTSAQSGDATVTHAGQYRPDSSAVPQKMMVSAVPSASFKKQKIVALAQGGNQGAMEAPTVPTKISSTRDARRASDSARNQRSTTRSNSAHTPQAGDVSRSRERSQNSGPKSTFVAPGEAMENHSGSKKVPDEGPHFGVGAAPQNHTAISSKRGEANVWDLDYPSPSSAKRAPLSTPPKPPSVSSVNKQMLATSETNSVTAHSDKQTQRSKLSGVLASRSNVEGASSTSRQRTKTDNITISKKSAQIMNLPGSRKPSIPTKSTVPQQLPGEERRQRIVLHPALPLATDSEVDELTKMSPVPINPRLLEPRYVFPGEPGFRFQWAAPVPPQLSDVDLSAHRSTKDLLHPPELLKRPTLANYTDPASTDDVCAYEPTSIPPSTHVGKKHQRKRDRTPELESEDGAPPLPDTPRSLRPRSRAQTAASLVQDNREDQRGKRNLETLEESELPARRQAKRQRR
ncbi:hypothetical protein M427DRAFT_40235 [Gonapodya prolifera JEL478]|uniref:Uncharacterized protein n=1 Tax=Gonapodya prolifera (strain JEL478) TaxID=1344416 RepID=A0A139AZZ7_GONPJ|nr:hypothetical protein M427DRAFT_40235 [Gonapodya prolifera JEL478]|eukprot:KXS22318.1 hypothetical protein M427DRAFT_40235 [Gonapodya prolifera JEL478]